MWLSMGQMKNVKYFVMPDVFRMNVYSKLHEHRAPLTFDMLSLPLRMALISPEVCNNVATKPLLQPLSGESMTAGSANIDNGSRTDVCARGFWNAS